MSEQVLKLGNEEYIRLGDALKAAGVTDTGGQAKIMIQEGCVYVDGKVCTMRGAKIRAGQVIKAADMTVRVEA